MRCNICDRVLSEPQYNSDIKGYEPCDTCMEIIQDTLAGFKDRPSVSEDELGGLDLPIDLEDADLEIP